MNKSMPHSALLSAIQTLIEESRQQLAVTVNSTITTLYWRVGKTINQEVLNNTRADYGKQTVASLSKYLTVTYGKGWGEKQLRHCMRFAETFPEEEIVYALRRQLSWTHLRLIMFIEDPLKREFYVEMCKLEKWSSRQLQERINSMLFYHRRLKCLVAIDLKLGAFEAGFKGQMELYLRYLEKYENVEGENQPIGLILCAGKNKEHIELLQLDKSNIRVAEYITELTDKALLQKKMHQAIQLARDSLNILHNKDRE